MSIEIKHLKKAFGNSVILKDVNAVVNDGDVISVIGPSGCGKSTFIRCINMIDPPTDGQIFVDGEEITAKGYNLYALRQKVGMVFQSYNLFEHLTIVENVMLALTDLKHLSRQEAYDVAVENLKKVGLGNKLLNYPDSLSGGQKQRASIARALAVNPDVILLDEPTAALDPTMVREVESVIKDLAKSGKTMMVVTHEMRFARAISNRIFYMDHGELYEEGTPEEIFDNPKRERTKAFINHLKVFKYKFNAEDFEYEKAVSMITEFTENNEVPQESEQALRRLTDWLSKELIPDYVAGNNLFHIVNEFDEATGEIKTLIYASAGAPDKDELKKALETGLEKLCRVISVEEIDDPDYSLKVICFL